MKLNDFIRVMDGIAPRELAMDWDNPGLLIGTDKQDIKKVLVALDCSAATAQEAIEWGADLMLTHHPVFFRAVKRILPDDPETAAPYMLLRSGIALFAAHTNLDAAEGGVNDCLCGVFGLENVEKLPPESLGRIGTLPRAMTFGELARLSESRLSTRVRIAGDADAVIRRIAVIGGGGAEELFDARAAGADAYITGEMKHHLAIQAEFIGLNVIEAGHYETERIVLPRLLERLQRETNDVQYRLTLSESPCLRGI